MELERWLENVVRNPVTQTNSKTLTQASFGYVEIFHTKSWENLEISWEILWLENLVTS